MRDKLLKYSVIGAIASLMSCQVLFNLAQSAPVVSVNQAQHGRHTSANASYHKYLNDRLDNFSGGAAVNYSTATTTKDGLMAKEDKVKTDNTSRTYNPMAYGAYGDGTTHPISGAYTLEAAKSKWSNISTIITTTNHETDWCATMSAAKDALANNATLVIDKMFFVGGDTVTVESVSGINSNTIRISGTATRNTGFITDTDTVILKLLQLSGVIVENIILDNSRGIGTAANTSIGLQIGDTSHPVGSAEIINVTSRWLGTGIDIRNASYTNIEAPRIFSPSYYGIVIQNLDNPDAGDISITNGTLAGDPSGGSLAGIYQLSSGGLRLSNNKTQYFNNGIQLVTDTGIATGILQIIGNSVENFFNYAINLLNSGAGSTWVETQIQNNQIGTHQVGAQGIIVDGLTSFDISNNTGYASATGAEFLRVKNSSGGNIGANAFSNYSTGVITESTVTNTRVAPQVGVDSGISLVNQSTGVIDMGNNSLMVRGELTSSAAAPLAFVDVKGSFSGGEGSFVAFENEYVGTNGVPFLARKSRAGGAALSGDFGGTYRHQFHNGTSFVTRADLASKLLDASTGEATLYFATHNVNEGTIRVGLGLDEKQNIRVATALPTVGANNGAELNLLLTNSSSSPSTGITDFVALRGTDISGAGTTGLEIKTEDNKVWKFGTALTFPDNTTQTTAATSTSSGTAGLVQLADGSGGFTSNANLYVSGNTLIVPSSFLIGSLTSTSSTTALRADQGKVISDRIPAITAYAIPRSTSAGTAYEASPMYYNATGIGIGTATPITLSDIYSTSAAGAQLTIRDSVTSAGGGGVLNLRHQAASDNYAAANDRLGQISFGSRSSGGISRNGVTLAVYADENYGDSAIASHLRISTATTGATTPTERVRIKSTGVVRFIPQAAPASCELGDCYFDSTSNKLTCCTTAGTPGTWTAAW